MRSWLWLERSGLAPESGRARLRQLEKGIMEKGAKGEGIMAIVGKVYDTSSICNKKNSRWLISMHMAVQYNAVVPVK